MKHYTQLIQLTQEERYQIHARNKAEHNQTDIAMILARDKSTVRRELQRNSALRGYCPQQAQRLTEERRQARANPSIAHSLWRQVEPLLREDWSHGQISLWLKTEYTVPVSHECSHEWIYRYILQDKACGSVLYHHLPCKKQRRKRYGSYNRRDQLIDRSALMNDLPLSMRVPDSVTGNPIPLLGKVINTLSSHSLNANHVIR